MPWKKGQSGNPKGRAPEHDAMRKLARQHGPAAIKALARGLKDPDKYPYCAVALLDRGYGKPKQEIDATVTNIDAGINAPDLPPDEVEAWLAKRAKERAQAQANKMN